MSLISDLAAELGIPEATLRVLLAPPRGDRLRIFDLNEMISPAAGDTFLVVDNANWCCAEKVELSSFCRCKERRGELIVTLSCAPPIGRPPRLKATAAAGHLVGVESGVTATAAAGHLVGVESGVMSTTAAGHLVDVESAVTATAAAGDLVGVESGVTASAAAGDLSAGPALAIVTSSASLLEASEVKLYGLCKLSGHIGEEDQAAAIATATATEMLGAHAGVQLGAAAGELLGAHAGVQLVAAAGELLGAHAGVVVSCAGCVPVGRPAVVGIWAYDCFGWRVMFESPELVSPVVWLQSDQYQDVSLVYNGTDWEWTDPIYGLFVLTYNHPGWILNIAGTPFNASKLGPAFGDQFALYFSLGAGPYSSDGTEMNAVVRNGQKLG